MNPSSTVDATEMRGFTFLQAGRWSDARECFTEMLSHPLEPIRRAGILRNIMGTYAQEGAAQDAMEFGSRALQVLYAHRASGECAPSDIPEIAELESNIKAHLQRLQTDTS